MKSEKIRNVEIEAIVACLPQNRITTQESCLELYGEKGVETLIKATGIEARYIVSSGTTSLDLCVVAAKEALKKTKTEKDEIGAVICVTFTPEHIMPADAPAAQFRLGLPNNCLAFDINMACSGYGYGLFVSSLLANQLGKKVLLLDGDVQSAFVSAKDKATMPVMSDVGTATIVKPVKNGNEWTFAFYTDGAQKDILYIPAGGSKIKTTMDDIEEKKYDDGSLRRNTEIYMNGFEIFKFVAITASRYIKEFMEEEKIDNSNIDMFVPHQANMYMISELSKKLKISSEKMWKSGNIYGNPSSASVPLTIAANAEKWFKTHSGKRMLFSGFGGGLSISVGAIDLNINGYFKVINYRETCKTQF